LVLCKAIINFLEISGEAWLSNRGYIEP